MLQHHAVRQYHKNAFLCTVDSDVVILSVHLFPTLERLGLEKLWIGFGSGKAFTDISIHEVATQLGSPKCNAVAFFHAFPGCAVISCMQGIRKKSAWKAWMHFPEVTNTLAALTENPEALTGVLKG
jgi:hypothetical protein